MLPDRNVRSGRDRFPPYSAPRPRRPCAPTFAPFEAELIDASGVARRALDDLGPLKLGKGTQHGQRQLVLGVLFVVLAVDSDLLAAFQELADDDELMRHV